MQAQRTMQAATDLPLVATTIPSIRLQVDSLRARGMKTGLVPTMGFFHEGHLSLMRAARRECDFVAVSIFVNPAQFGPGEDLDAYPRDRENDLRLAARESVDLVFIPDEREIYGGGAEDFKDSTTSGIGGPAYIEPGSAAEGLCGSARPGHFRGVATVVAKLFNIFQPDAAYFGQKDAQQVAVIRQMVRDLDFDLDIRVLPTVREPGGLALSSRNAYLSPEESGRASVLRRALLAAHDLANSGERDADVVRKLLAETISLTPGVTLEYAEVVNADTMRPAGSIDEKSLAAVAVSIGGARLIDNIFLLGGVD